MSSKRKNRNASDSMNDNTTDDIPRLGDGSGSSQPMPTAEPSLAGVMNVMAQNFTSNTRREEEQKEEMKKQQA